MPYAKNHIRVNVPKRSGFDKSHRNSGTGTCGTLIPLLCDEVVPNTRVHLRVPIAAQMPPLVSETYMNVKLKMEAFFVPMRLLCGSFESFFTDFPKRLSFGNGGSSVVTPSYFSEVKGLLPVLNLNTDEIASQNYFPAGSLGDYLGIGTGLIDTDSRGVGINLMPFLAYHKVWEDYYRNPRVQNPAFAPFAGDYNNETPLRVSACPFSFLHDSYSVSGANFAQNYYLVKSDAGALTADARFNLADGISLFSFRQRNFGLDYFTGARVDAQQGDAVSVRVPAPGEGDLETSFSIASLRAANSLQQFRERNNLPSPRLIDQVKARYGAILSDGVAQRPICIGSATMDMYTHGVDQTANDPDSSTGKNPFNSVAAQYGRASVSGNELLIENFTANEPGYILVLVSQVPEVSYTLGVNPIFRRYLGPGSIVQMANPLLQNMGDQPIYISELNGLVTPNVVDTVFGYQDRFADFMFIKNQIHGLFRAGQDLSAFVAQRTIGSNVELSSAFLEIPKNYLDDVLAVSQAADGLTFWYDSYLDYKVSMPLAEFSIPSLQDPAYEHGESISLRRNGQIF